MISEDSIRGYKSERAHRASLLKGVLCVLFFSFFSCPVSAQERKADSVTSRVVFYNVENLFDTIDDPDKDDTEFLPDGVLQWDQSKYKDKLSRIARVLSDIGGWSHPGLIGLCEVESEQAIEDLLSRKELTKVSYKYAITNGGDNRGIDVALLWDPALFKVMRMREIPAYPLPDEDRLWVPYHGERPTYGGRHALWVTLKTEVSDLLLDVIVVHLPSRRQGAVVSADKRETVAGRIRQVIGEIMEECPDAHVIVMGDFNDNPTDRSITKGLGAKSPPKSESPHSGTLYNLAALTHKNGKGTHKFEGRFWMPDQIIVSGAMLQEGGEGIRAEGMVAHVFSPDYLMTNDGAPKRAFRGKSYVYGFSDHFPVYIDIRF